MLILMKTYFARGRINLSLLLPRSLLFVDRVPVFIHHLLPKYFLQFLRCYVPGFIHHSLPKDFLQFLRFYILNITVMVCKIFIYTYIYAWIHIFIQIVYLFICLFIYLLIYQFIYTHSF